MYLNKNFETIIQRSDKSYINISFIKNLYIKSFDSKNTLIGEKKLLDGKYSFVDLWFNIDKKDNIYGVVNNKIDSLIYYYIKDNILIKTPLLYYSNNYFIKFPTIYNSNDETSLFYYINNSSNSLDIIHMYKKNNCWVKNTIDSLKYNILSNYIVINENNSFQIFYFKKIKNCEELFFSQFNKKKVSWSTPIQITDTHQKKIYLSVIYSDDAYHITYSENKNNHYIGKYLKLTLDNKNINITTKKINNSIACIFPHVIKYKNKLFIQWLEFEKLYTVYSNNTGDNWLSTNKITNINISTDIIRYTIISNYLTNNGYNLSTAWIKKNSIKPIDLCINFRGDYL